MDSARTRPDWSCSAPRLGPSVQVQGKSLEQRVSGPCAACKTMLSPLCLPKWLVLLHAEAVWQYPAPSLLPCLAVSEHAAPPAWSHTPVSPPLTLRCGGTARAAPHGCSLLHGAGREAQEQGADAEHGHLPHAEGLLHGAPLLDCLPKLHCFDLALVDRSRTPGSRRACILAIQTDLPAQRALPGAWQNPEPLRAD